MKKKYICVNNGMVRGESQETRLEIGMEYEGEIKGDRIKLSYDDSEYFPERFEDAEIYHAKHSYSIF